MFRFVEFNLDKNRKFFDFPFAKFSENSDIKFIENSDNPLFLCDYLKYEWFRIVVTPYFWNNQESLMVI
jgi:hypothetical protein